MKRLYVSFIRMLRVVFRAVGLLSFWERRMERSRWARWLRSLFAVYDFDDLVKLDLPWWNLEAVDWVSNYLEDKPGVRAFEYGCGASTVWLSRRCDTVTTIEHDLEWAKVVTTKFESLDNVAFKAIPPTEGCPVDETAYLCGRAGWEDRSFKSYVTSIREQASLFDVIVIDGRARSACLEEAKSFLAEDGIIIFDNAGRDRYKAAIDTAGLEQIRFSGLTACLPYPDQTYILRKATDRRDPA